MERHILVGPDRNAEGVAIGFGCVVCCVCVCCVLSKFFWNFFFCNMEDRYAEGMAIGFGCVVCLCVVVCLKFFGNSEFYSNEVQS